MVMGELRNRICASSTMYSSIHRAAPVSYTHLDFGYEDYVYGDALCFIEWPEKIEDLLPPDTVDVYIEEQPDGSRLITMKHS